MPYVNIQVTDENVTTEQKAQLIQATTKMLEDILAKPPSSTFVVIEEVPLENWGFGGVSVAELRKRK